MIRRNGELLQSYEPHDLPGAFILTRHKVIDPTGAVPFDSIQWSGPGEWIESREGVPEGHVALCLGSRNAARHIVTVTIPVSPRSGDAESCRVGCCQSSVHA